MGKDEDDIGGALMGTNGNRGELAHNKPNHCRLSVGVGTEQVLEVVIPRQAVLDNDLSPVAAPFHILLNETRHRGAMPHLLQLDFSAFDRESRLLACRPEVQYWFYHLHRRHPALPFWLDVPSIQLYLRAAMVRARYSPKAQMLRKAGLHLLDRGLTAAVMEVLGAGQLLCYEMFPRDQALMEALIAVAIGRLEAAMVTQFSHGLVHL